MTRIISVLALAGLAGTVSLSAQMKHVDLKDAKGNSVGMAMVSPVKGGGVSIDLDVKGLPPGEHALHFHAVPKCEGPDFTSAGGHFNPANKKHGMQNPEGAHAGDMMNFTVDAKGNAKTTITNKNVTMGAEPNSLYTNGGTALMIHAAADDMKTDPSGNAGGRIACGGITK
ncbi:MAG: superoxide dismutase family protein [Cyanobacteria bacterium]|nr:superoxide dismutase family protein [Cyanobacteriota bacterium]